MAPLHWTAARTRHGMVRLIESALRKGAAA
jgi:hypothetical protein